MTTESDGPQSGTGDGGGLPPLDSGALAGRWVLDGQQSSVRFQSTSLWGLVKVHGRFATVRGEGEIGPDGETTGRLVADVASVDTGNKKRDTHLRSADFFDASTHPELVYEMSKVTASGPDSVRLTGTLSIAGQSRPLELDAVVTDRDAAGVTLQAKTAIDRSEWRIDWKKMGMTKMATPIEISARIVRAG